MTHTLRMAATDLFHWPARRWITAATASLVIAVTAGVPTDVLPNPFFDRQVPVQWWNYPVLVATALLGGLVAATYVRSPAEPAGMTRATGGGLLSFLAIGCPACNKVIVLLLGTSGALTVWHPLQPVLGAGSLVMLGWVLRTRLTTERACPVPRSGSPRSGRDGKSGGVAALSSDPQAR